MADAGGDRARCISTVKACVHTKLLEPCVEPRQPNVARQGQRWHRSQFQADIHNIVLVASGYSTLKQRHYMAVFCSRCGSEVYASASACTQCGEPQEDPFEIRPVEELIWPAFVSLAFGATCAASLWNHRDVSTWQSLLAGLISAAGLGL